MPSTDDSTLTLDCDALPVRQIHRLIRSVVEGGKATRVRLINPKARHNLGVAMPEGLQLTIDGPAGYYAAGLNDGATGRYVVVWVTQLSPTIGEGHVTEVRAFAGP